MKDDAERRIAGVLVPVFALRGKVDLGIGDTAALIEFIDWAADVGFELVEILPINETLGMHSPYSAISARALDPLTVHTTPAAMPDLTEAAFEAAKRSTAGDRERVDYQRVAALKMSLLRAAWANFTAKAEKKRQKEFEGFREAEREWLRSYTLFRVLMDEQGHEAPWRDWPPALRSAVRAEQWVAGLPQERASQIEEERRFYAYVQWVAFEQWRAVKARAEQRGVALMGDIPFGIAEQSCDVWAHPELFVEGWWGGTPPDKFFTHDAFVQKWGQNWGIPIYHWEAMREDDYRWWRQRVAGVRQFFDLFRVDHILGFYRIYGFPWPPQRNDEFLPLSEEEAAERTGERAPRFIPRADASEAACERNRIEGEEYLKVLVKEAGEGRLIGEDLGEVPSYVRPSLTSVGIAGYKVPSWERTDDGRLIEGKYYPRMALATYATHDHEPLKVMWDGLAARTRDGDFGARQEMERLALFAGIKEAPEHFSAELHEALIRALLACNARLAVFMITDLFGREERYNLPGVAEASWTQRLHVPVSDLGLDPAIEMVRRCIQEERGAGVNSITDVSR